MQNKQSLNELGVTTVGETNHPEQRLKAELDSLGWVAHWLTATILRRQESSNSSSILMPIQRVEHTMPVSIEYDLAHTRHLVFDPPGNPYTFSCVRKSIHPLPCHLFDCLPRFLPCIYCTLVHAQISVPR